MNGPCLCGDPYCHSCGDPGLAEREALEEKIVDIIAKNILLDAAEKIMKLIDEEVEKTVSQLRADDALAQEMTGPVCQYCQKKIEEAVKYLEAGP